MTNEWYWHIHHSAQLVEYADFPIEERIEYIKKFKPKDEIDTRLRLLHPVASPDITYYGKEYQETVYRWVMDHRMAWQRLVQIRDASCNSKYYLDINVYTVESERIEQEFQTSYKLLRARTLDAIQQEKIVQVIERLHRQECLNCPWNGYTIFPEKEE